jgi:ATP-dependent Clp protease adaptor protein ClpS
MPKSETKTKIKPLLNLQEPPLWKIIYMNDDVTSMEFVIESLINFFDYNNETASNLTTKIHHEGSAVVAILPYEIAETRGIEVTMAARAKGYPLLIKVEAEA